MSHYTPVIPDQYGAQRLVTYQDAAETVLDRYDRNSSGRDLRLARRAVLDAYDELARRHEWTWLSRVMQLAVSPVYDTGTIAYDHTGGTHERQVTLSSGVWPDDAAMGYLVIEDQQWYTIEDRKSSTVLTLREGSNPGEDLDAGTTYFWMREAYPIPPDFWQSRTPLDTERGSNLGRIEYMDMDDLMIHNRARGKYVSADTTYYAFGSDDRSGSVCLLVGPPLSTSRTLTIPYQSLGRRIGVYLETAGTVSVATGATALTGVDTSFDSQHVGAVIRLSGTAARPTSRSGGLDGTYNPALESRIVKSVTDGTTLVLDAAVRETYNGAGYTISDPLDIDVQVMGNCFQAMADYHFVRSERGMVSEERAALIRQAFQQLESRELPLAKEADTRFAGVSPSVVWGGKSWYWPFASLTLLPPG